MAFGYYGYNQPMMNYQNYQQPVPDQLQQLRQSYQMPAQMQQQTSPDERIWVQGQGAAEAYLVAPNSFVRLWDSQRPVFYEKRADATGKPYMDTYEYSRKSADAPNTAVFEEHKEDYTKQIKALEKRIQELEQRIEKGGVANVSESNANAAEV